MSPRSSAFRKWLASYLVSIAAALGIVFVYTSFPSSSPTALNVPVAAACLFLGLAWLVLGWVFNPSVETYVGPGAMKGIPILWPSSAIPERNEPVLDDLASKLGPQADMGTVLAILGFVLMTTGVVFYISALVGSLALVLLVGSVVALLLYSGLPRTSRANA